ncbi:MAG: hypothetical protein PQ964_05640 [Methanobacteriaceae archaeon]|jgi:uncharacterized protein (UPF0332 family)
MRRKILMENAYENLEAAKTLFENDYGLLSELGKKEAGIIIEGVELFLEECKSLISP